MSSDRMDLDAVLDTAIAARVRGPAWAVEGLLDDVIVRQGVSPVLSRLRERAKASGGAPVLALLGHVLASSGDDRGAEQALLEAHRLDVTDPGILERLLEIHEQRGAGTQAHETRSALVSAYERRGEPWQAMLVVRAQQRSSTPRSYWSRLRSGARRRALAIPAMVARKLLSDGIRNALSERVVGPAGLYRYQRDEIVRRCEELRTPLLRRTWNALPGFLERAEHAPGVMIFLPTIKWGHLFQRPHQLLRELAARGYLCFFCTPDPAADGLEDDFREVAPNLILCGDARLLTVFESPLLMMTSTLNQAYLPYFPGGRSIYDFVDELDVFYAFCPEMVTDHHRLLQRAHFVTCSADKLADSARATRPDAALIPNGVRMEDFRDIRPETPRDLAEVLLRGKPIVGYYGAIASWFDFDLFNATAKAAPDLSFVVIGPDYDASAHRIQPQPNVLVLPQKPYVDLPTYSSRFDVATIPFLVNDITRSTSPVKLFEYMATGLPIVTTSMHECAKYKSVFVARDRDDYMACLRRALTARRDPAHMSLLAEEAAQNTWSNRVDRLLAALGPSKTASPGRRA